MIGKLTHLHVGTLDGKYTLNITCQTAAVTLLTLDQNKVYISPHLPSETLQQVVYFWQLMEDTCYDITYEGVAKWAPWDDSMAAGTVLVHIYHLKTIHRKLSKHFIYPLTEFVNHISKYPTFA